MGGPAVQGGNTKVTRAILNIDKDKQWTKKLPYL